MAIIKKGNNMNNLDVKPYDPSRDTIEIEGSVYSGNMFRYLGCSFPNMVGHVFRIDKKSDGITTLTRMKECE